MGRVKKDLQCSKGKVLVPRYREFVQGSKTPLKVSGESKQIRCKAELVRVTSLISVVIAPPYRILTFSLLSTFKQ